MKSNVSKKTFTIISILALSDVLIMAVPFYLKNVISSVTIANSLGITSSEFSQANAIYGYVALLSYFIGGYFADRINLKKLTFIGLGTVGIVSIWYAFIPFIGTHKIIQIYIIFALWSFITCFIFWSALWKLLSEQGTSKENGKLNGLHGSLNGIIGTILISFAYLISWIFKNILTQELSKWSFTILVLIFTIMIFLNCFLIWKVVPESKNNNIQAEAFELKTFLKTLKNYKLWMVTFLIMGVYMFQTGLSVFVAYMNDALKILPFIVIIAGILRTYFFRFLFSAPAGKLADKTQKYILFIVIGLMVSSILTISAILLPGFSNTDINSINPTIRILVQVCVITLYLLLGITTWTLVTNRWATIYEIKISQKEYAASVGFISFIAFSPDAWFWQIDAILLKKFGTEAGYLSDKLANQISLIITATIGISSTIIGIALLLILKKEKITLPKLNQDALINHLIANENLALQNKNKNKN